MQLFLCKMSVFFPTNYLCNMFKHWQKEKEQFILREILAVWRWLQLLLPQHWIGSDSKNRNQPYLSQRFSFPLLQLEGIIAVCPHSERLSWAAWSHPAEGKPLHNSLSWLTGRTQTKNTATLICCFRMLMPTEPDCSIPFVDLALGSAQGAVIVKYR